MASDFGDYEDIEIEDREGWVNDAGRPGSEEEHADYVAKAVLQKHPLRVALASFLASDLYEILRTIEWCDSGDKMPDAWIPEILDFLDNHNIEYDENWKTVYAELAAKHGVNRCTH